MQTRPVHRLSDAMSIRRQFPIFARRKLHYLDSAATAQVPRSVAAAVELFDLRLRANVYGGVYSLARDALSAYEQSRQDVARFLGANSASEIVFPKLVTKRCRLISFTHCSNVTGALTDVAAVVKAARTVGALVALDGAQAAPHGPLDVRKLGIDFYAFSGHKTFGPTGIGVLWGRKALLAEMPPFMVGGQMIRSVSSDSVEFADPPRRFEAGTPPIGAAIGLGAAIRWMETLDWPTIAEREQRLTKRVLYALERIPGVQIVGPCTTTERLGVISFAVHRVSSESVCRIMDQRAVALRHGHHCAQPLMRTLGLEGTARVSLAPYVTDEDIDAFIAGLDDIQVELLSG